LEAATPKTISSNESPSHAQNAGFRTAEGKISTATQSRFQRWVRIPRASTAAIVSRVALNGRRDGGRGEVRRGVEAEKEPP
jgi:hypothetical protein